MKILKVTNLKLVGDRECIALLFTRYAYISGKVSGAL